jgi:ADP-dependent NAD(P)H-hydrate dehydratase / NAD(P)H-hydrate epimerase
MENTSWLRQTKGPLFPDISWSRPENKRYAGKLLIIGGHKQSFNEVSVAYSAALKAGVGNVRVVLPDSLQKMLAKVFPEAEYAASTPIGSFSRQALGTLLDAGEWADAILLAGDLGKNSETAILLESLVEKCGSKLILTGDSIDYFLNQPSSLNARAQTLLIASLSQLQKLAVPALIQQTADFIKVIEQVSSWADSTNLSVVTLHSNQAIVVAEQRVSATPLELSTPNVTLAAYATVWWLQQPTRPFEALTTAIYCYIEG